VQALKVSVAELLGRPGEYRDIAIREPLEGISNALVHLDEQPVVADLRAESVVEGILMTGQVTGTMAAECARCLKAFQGPVTAEVCELFVAPGREEGADEDAYRVSGTEVALEPMLRDALALALPLRPLCREDCRGICARCGADLNAGPCGCVEDSSDPRWAGLDVVRERLQQRSS
jgi:uncharacterized protein